jgi:hypothetical protein
MHLARAGLGRGSPRHCLKVYEGGGKDLGKKTQIDDSIKNCLGGGLDPLGASDIRSKFKT